MTINKNDLLEFVARSKSLCNGITLQLAVDIETGHLYWSEHSSSDQYSVYHDENICTVAHYAGPVGVSRVMNDIATLIELIRE